MNKVLSIVFFLLYSNLSLSQTSVPDILFNGQKSQNGIIESCFLPVQIDFNFSSSDTAYTIKKGFVVFNRHSTSDTIFISSNHLRNETALPGKSIEIVIDEIELKVQGLVVRTDAISFSKTFQYLYTPLKQKELQYINNNKCSLICNDKLINTDKVLTLKDKNEWQISIEDSNQVGKFDIIMVRGKRPVASKDIKGISGTEDYFKRNVQDGDCVLVRIYGLDQKTTIFSKVVFVK